MRTQKRLEKISTALSLLALGLGFSVLGLLIVAKEREDGASIASGIPGIFLGATLMIAACLHWKRGDQIQGGLLAEETPVVEIVSETRQASNAIFSF
jgi:TRAP-type C4-dicarboxylate transport system permease small subunit